MDNKKIADKLVEICQLDIDALHAYMNANDHIGQAEIKNTVLQFQADHGRHIQDLSDTIRKYGGKPPEVAKDFKGYLLAAFASMRSVTGTEGALKALKSGEEMTNKTYGDAVKKDFPSDVLTLLYRNFNDEKRHLDYINRAIESEAWKKAA